MADKIRKYLANKDITDDELLKRAKDLEGIELPDPSRVLDSLNRKFAAVQELRELERTRNNKEIAGFVAQELAEFEKKSAKPRKAKPKKTHVPTRKAEQRKWALLYEFYDHYYRINKLNAMQFRLKYEVYDGLDKPLWIPQDNEVLQNIIDEGNKGNIPKYEDIK